MMNTFPFFSASSGKILLRVCVSLIMMAHGVMRLIENSLSDFGAFLNSKGFLIGTPLAWGITFFELIGGLMMILNYGTTWISLILILELLTGIILVHAQNGWFVVGHQSGGIEYSVLLIICLLIIAANSNEKKSVNR